MALSIIFFFSSPNNNKKIVLKTLETASLRNKHGPEFKKQVDQALEKHLPSKSNLSQSPNLLEERRKDHISHFVLRLAYCRR